MINRIVYFRKRRYRVCVLILAVLFCVVIAISLRATKNTSVKHSGPNPYDVTFQPFMLPDFSYQTRAKPKMRGDRNHAFPWIPWYISYHKKSILDAGKQRKFLVFTSTCKRGQQCPYFLHRLAGAVSALYLAILLDRTLIIRWQGSGFLDGRYFSWNEIDWTDRPWRYDDLTAVKLYLGVRNGHQPAHEIAGYAHKYFSSDESLTKWIKKTNFFKLSGIPVVYLETAEYFAEALLENKIFKKRAESLGLVSMINPALPNAVLGHGIDLLFKNAPYLFKLLSKTKHVLESTVGTRPCIGIHIRKKNDAGEQISFYNTKLMKVLRCATTVENILKTKHKEYSKANFTWYLATDDYSLKAEALMRYPRKVVVLDISAQTLSSREQDLSANVIMDQMMLSECVFFLPTKGSMFSNFVMASRGFSTSNIAYEEECPSLAKQKMLAASPDKRRHHWLL